LVVLFVQRGRDGIDLSLGGLLRLYLYLASLAGVIAFAIGVAGIISYVLAAAFGLDVIYGGPRAHIEPAFPVQGCPPGTTCPALLPMGIYQALSIAIVPPNQFTFRPGAGDALSGGLAALPLWLGYLWLVQRALRTAPPTSPTVA